MTHDSSNSALAIVTRVAARASVKEGAAAFYEFILPGKQRNLKVIVDLTKAFGVVAGVFILAQYFAGDQVPDAFKESIGPVGAHRLMWGLRIFAAVLGFLNCLQAIAIVWPSALMWLAANYLRLSLRTDAKLEPVRWKRMTYSALGYVVDHLIALLLAGLALLFIAVGDMTLHTDRPQVAFGSPGGPQLKMILEP